MNRVPALGAAGLLCLALSLSACARSVPARQTPPPLATPTPGSSGQLATPTDPPGASTSSSRPGGSVVGTVHVVQEGDTLFSLANRYGVSVQAIMSANGLSDPDAKLRAGSTLIIPVEGSTSEPAAATQPEPAQTYTVQPGDTLVTIAQRHGTTVEALIEANDLANPELLSVGQVLKIPSGGAARSSGGSAGEVSVASVGIQYTVQPGDTLWAIAQAYGTTPSALMAANNLESATQIYVGQVLTIPVESGK